MMMTKNQIGQIQINDYNYPLPDEKIAKFPLSNRDRSRLLVYQNGNITDSSFYRIGEHLPPNAGLVYNNTKVIHARLEFFKESGARIEIFCLTPLHPSDYVYALSCTDQCVWECMIGNSKRWKEGPLTKEITIKDQTVRFSAQREENHSTPTVRFTWDNPLITFGALLEAGGILPIPPYLGRETEESDNERYQTVYSAIEGSVAAPTAGLHFTDSLLEQLQQSGIKLSEVTLHVGAGTFLPVKSEQIKDHSMHNELIVVQRQTIIELIRSLDHTIAVGTTSVRTLESLYFVGQQIAVQMPQSETVFQIAQWEPYQQRADLSAADSLENILRYLDTCALDHITASTCLMIAPGYQFRIVKGIITNFHQPCSTLLLLVSAFVQGEWKKIYDHALDHSYRFLSYGDSSLLLP